MPWGQPRFAHARTRPRWGSEHAEFFLSPAIMRALSPYPFASGIRKVGAT